MEYETVIGLEIHTQLATKSKIFSNAATDFGTQPNSQANIIDLAMPGVLPVLNKQVVVMALKFGLAIGAKINNHSIFARKNYFYPDLPKGYQISQFEIPIVGNGNIEIELDDGVKKTINITRAHLEEDAGKSIHDIFDGVSAIDLNRAGIPLLEIVSEPDMRNSKEAISYAKKIHSLVQYLAISDGNMQEGSFRCDANISLRPKGQKEYGTRAEIKNINSFKYLENAITYEVQRQADILDSGDRVVQETRLYDSIKDETRSMRSKEEANDYRYFPDPDLLPVEFDDKLLADIKNNLPELPDAKKQRFINSLKLNSYDASVLTTQKELADYFEDMLSIGLDAKLCANWVLGDFMAMLHKHHLNITNSPILAKDLGLLVLRISDNTISGKIAKEVFVSLWQKEGSVDKIIADKGLKQISDNSAIEKIITEVINNNTKQVQQYQGGNERLFGFFVGQVMKLSSGRANPKLVNELLKKKLKN